MPVKGKITEDIVREKYNQCELWFDLKPIPKVYCDDTLKTQEMLEWENNLAPLMSGYIRSCRHLGGFGLNQVELISKVVGVEPTYPDLPEFKNPTGDYYTLCNEAWGNAPIKTWYSKRWEEVVNSLDKEVIQVGEYRDESIRGTTNLTGKLTFKEACNVVSKSRLHLGIEGFWNHFCVGVNVKAIILFGPTSMFFSYPHNVNIESKDCKECWWTSGNWMNECPKGFKIDDRPCMNSISVDEVLDATKNGHSSIIG